MGELIQFVPREDLQAKENLREFIRLCREDLTTFGADLRWSDWRWERVVIFTKLGVRTKVAKESDCLAAPFIEFAKAYFRYQQGHHRTDVKAESMALRAIEAALLQLRRKPEVGELDRTVLDQAAAIAREHYSKSAAYTCGRELMRLARFVTKNELILTDIASWKSPLKKPSDLSIQTGEVAKALRDKKLPSRECLDAMAQIFANCPTAPRDIFTTSVFALSMCAPSRGTELLLLPVDVDWEEKDLNDITRYGWRFFSEKGFEGDIKWIPSVMAPIAKEAIRRIRTITDEPRRLAKWLEDEPLRFYRHADCPEVEDDEPLSAEQTLRALGLSAAGVLPTLKLSRANGAHTLNSLWQWVRRWQPEGFPWIRREIGLKYSNALFCGTRRMLATRQITSPVRLWAPSVDVFNNDLGPMKTGGQIIPSIFMRWGYGSDLKMTSHQARHLLSTIADRGGLTQDEAAKWAGRADPKQNRVYIHRSEWEKVTAAEAIDPSLTLFGPHGSVPLREPLTRDELIMIERGPVHITEFGVCIHDWVISPCDKFRDCANCQEHVFIKGEDQCLKRIKERLAQTEIDFAKAEEALRNGFAGADRWYESHQREVSRLLELVRILEDPNLPDGSQIKLRGGDFSHLRRVINSKASAQLLETATAEGLMVEAARRLGGGRWQNI